MNIAFLLIKIVDVLSIFQFIIVEQKFLYRFSLLNSASNRPKIDC